MDDTAYTYDLAGNTTQQTDTRSGSSSTAETQCFTYDALDRLTTAWTATDACAATPTSSSHSTVGDGITGGAYWTSWTYDAIGNRDTQTQHTVSGTAADTVTHNAYSSSQPNTLTGTTTTGGTTASTSYGYDDAGNTTTRDTSTGNQSLVWNNSDQLTTVSNSTTGTSTNYIYDADGNLLLQIDPTTTTLYLGSEQITLNTSAGTATGVRYYSLPGGATVVRTGTGTNYGFELASDQHGTNSLYLDSTAQTPTWRQFDPYGNSRGTTATWVDNRTFLDKPTDTATALTDVGAREYDPTIGRFISLDPVFEADSSQELNGYAYAGDNPVTESDPTGLESCYPHFCSGSNGTYGTYHSENDPASKDYKGSSHYCDTHKCSSGTASSDSGNVSKQTSGNTTKTTQAQQAAAREKAASARARRMAAAAADKQKSCGFTCGISKFFHGLVPHGEGLCGSFGVSAGLSVSASICLVSIKGHDGVSHTTLTGSGGVGLGLFGFSVAGDTVYTNADDVSQLTGWGGQLEGTAGEGLLGHAAIGTGGSKNSEGALVYMAQVGLGGGVDFIPPAIPANITGGVSDTFILHRFN
ncbi:hypothetical protein MQP27_33070 [Streptomyces sp. 7R015]|uniref:RHS repeat-associated core domain-containing protein n=1 Tax=Streptomyces cylindrosporus TaxID=2927583 RepID=A0ABS9YFF7_9ACTN|nr:hypothetical protein [Streptomyces cylindrosporus]